MKTFYKLQQSFLAIVILVFCYTLNSKIYAQYQYADSTNLQLRHIFSQITYPDNDILFLNERSAKLSDSLLYQINNPDTIHQMQWYQVYKEMYYAAHDTLTQVPFNDLMGDANNYGLDTIPMGIMDWQFYSVKYDAIHTPDYFIFDLTNNYFLDHPSPIASPYTIGNIFMATPLLHQSKFLEVTFAIDPDFIFRDNNTIYDYYNPYELQIDFGDGNGFITINPNTTSYITVEYPTNGEKVIQTRLFSTEGEFVVKSSNSRLFINNNSLPIRPDYVLNNIPGMNVGVYTSCQGESTGKEKKIILVEGFDFMDEIPSLRTGIEEIYHSHIKSERLQHLRNFGYSYYVVDWKDSKTDMRYNALNLLCLIEYLKATSDNDEEFVIIGISMGGVIARYTLNFMESSHYQTLNFSPFFVENSDPYNQSYLAQNPNFPTAWQELLDDQLLHLNHNTRLLITIDSPHQGANIPLAYQYIYRFAESTLGYIVPGMLILKHSVPQLSILDILNKKSPRQLLKWYVHPGASAFSINTYSPNSSHSSFYNQLKSFSLDGVPTYAKMVALTDGALDGSPQQDPNTNNPRNYNDYILDYEFSSTIRVLFVHLPFIGARVDARTNPSGFGPILNASYGITLLKIKIKLYGITISTNYLPLIPGINAYANNSQPTCVTAGGWENVFNRNNTSYLYNWDFYGLFGFSYYRVTESNGTGFCFVPLESALDYRGSQAFNNDILNENINTKLANTPFDVIAGQVVQGLNDLGYPNTWSNHKHTANKNDRSFVYNLTQQDAAGPPGGPAPDHNYNEHYAYYTCAAVGNYEAKRTFLSQEIGDEELYLENFISNRTTSYRTEFDIKVNERNPYYEYPSQVPSPPISLDGVYSKEDDFDIASGGFATFYYDSGSQSPSPGLTINYLNSPDYTDVDEPYGICCTAPSARLTYPIKKDKTTSSWLNIYPNPANGYLVIDATFSYDEPSAKISVNDLSGKQLFTKQLNISNKKINHTLSVAEMKLAKGIYFIKVATKHFSQTNKLIIY